MGWEKTEDREIKRDSRTGIYFYRGTPIRGGKEVARSLGVRTFRAAVSAKKDLLLRLRGLDLKVKDVPFRDYVKVFLTERRQKAPATYESAFYSCNQLLQFFDTHTMKAITEAAWTEYVEYQGQINPGRLLRYDRKHLRMMMLRLKKKGLLEEVPEFQLKERETKRKRVLTQAEVDLIFKYATGTIYGLSLFMYRMGNRPGEVLGAPWKEFDLNKGIWAIPAERSKTRTARTIKVNPTVLEWLKARKKDVKGDFVFPTRENPNTPIDRYNKQWDRLLAKINRAEGSEVLDPEITPYYLRHTFLTECAKRVRDGSLSLVLITKYAGTSIEEFERTYLHVEGEDTKAVAELMEAPI